MKKYLLMLFVAVMATASFAQLPVKLNKLNANSQKQVTLTSEQRKNVVGSVEGRSIKMHSAAVPGVKKAKKKSAISTQYALQAPAMPKLHGSLNEDAQSAAIKPVTKSTARKARKVGSKEAVVAPDGIETETYTLNAFSYYAFSEVKHDVQVGIAGSDVYVQGLFEQAPEAWIKGVSDGKKVTFAKDQYIGEVEAFDSYSGESLGLMSAWLEYSADMETYTDLVVDLDESTGLMSDMAGGFLFLAIDDDFNALDALTGLLLTPASLAGDNTLVTPPASAEVKAVDISYTSYSKQKALSSTGFMALDGNDIYVGGLCPDMGTAWVKGTIAEDGTVTFASGQYVGSYSGIYDIYFTSISAAEAKISDTPSLRDAKAVWNAEEKTLTFDKDCWIVENASPVTLMYLDILIDMEVFPMSEDRSIVIPPASLQTQEYKATCVSVADYSYAKGSYTVKVGFDGTDAYVQGLLYFAPGAWLKGTLNGDGSITLPNNQYLGTVQGYDVYVVACDDDEKLLENITLAYDAKKDQYTYTEENTNISFSVAPNTTDAIEIIYNLVLQGSNGEGGGDDVDITVITEQPEGDVQVYSRQGGAYYSFFGYVINSSQNGTAIRIVTAPDGKTVYMENPISQAQVPDGTWIKGTKEGNKLHMPLKQCTYFSEEEGYGYITATFRVQEVYNAEYDENVTTYVMTDDTEVTFTIGEDGTITLDQTSKVDPETGYADFIYGLAYTDDFVWGGYGDFNSVYTPFNDETKAIPDGMETEEWAFMYNDGNYDCANIVKVAVDGDKMYIAGINAEDPEAAITGTLADGKVTFQSDQYVGMNSGFISYVAFATWVSELKYDEEWDEEYEDVTYTYAPEFSFTYDAEKKMLTSASDAALLINAGKAAEQVSFITACHTPKFNYFEDKAAKPADPEIQGFNNYFDDYGYDMLGVNVKLEDVDGNYMDMNKVYYIVWVKVDGEAEPFVFYADEYTGLTDKGLEEITEIPYNFVIYDEYGFEDIYVGGSNIILYQTGFDDYGIQTIYYGGGERNVSNIVWLNQGDGIQTVATGKQATTAQYNALGQRVGKNYRGIVIRDGKKVYVK